MARKKKPVNESEIKIDKDFQLWRNRWIYMKTYRDNAERKYGWKRFKNYFLGKYEEALGLSIPIVVINEVYSYVKTAVAGLYIKDPKIAVNPKRAGEEQSAKIKEQVLNYVWRDLRIGKQVKKAIAEAELTGFAWIKMGYDATVKQLEEVEINGEQTTKIEEPNEYIQKENVFATFVAQSDSNYIVYDPEACDPPYDCRWIMHVYKKPTEILRSKYNQPGIKSTYRVDKDTKQSFTDVDCEYTLVCEIWDKDSGYMKKMCDGWDEWLEEVAPLEDGCIGPYLIEGFPFEMLRFNEIVSIDGKDNYPMSNIAPQEPQILEKIKLRSMQLNHIKRFSRQLMTRRGTVKNEEMEKFTKGVDGAIIEIDGELSTSIAPISYPPIQTDIYAVENRIDIDRDKISGQPQMEQGGQATSKTRTLGELNLISQGASNRRQEQVGIVEDLCKNISFKLLQLMKQFFDIPKYARIVGEVPREFLAELQEQGKFDGVSIKYTKEDIQGEEDVDIAVGSTIPLNKENRIRTAIEALKVGQALGLGPESNASIALGKVLFHDIDMPQVEKAYNLDLLKLNQPKEPSAMDKMNLLSKKQSIDKGATDIELKKQRTVSVNLANAKKAIDNSKIMNGEDKKPGEQGGQGGM